MFAIPVRTLGAVDLDVTVTGNSCGPEQLPNDGLRSGEVVGDDR